MHQITLPGPEMAAFFWTFPSFSKEKPLVLYDYPALSGARPTASNQALT
ncbi:MAG: hypothetical protein M0Z99_23025 [Betaproteobacteria bacterium]|nr:hypothetical protein [Betaproteobacteria bacterium]